MARRFWVRACVLALAVLAGSAFAAVAQAENYIVLYKAQAVPADAAGSIQKAGGKLVYSYDQIGVAIASSTSSTFRDNLLKDQRVENASGTSLYATKLNDDAASQDSAGGPPAGDLPNSPATDTDSLSGLR